MTSSLVGSEMCIRDSHISEQLAHMRPRQPLTHLNGHITPLMSTQQTTDAVSYTHLTLPTICSV
eukprot:1556155-Prorocentrum_lima.AAC.1